MLLDTVCCGGEKPKEIRTKYKRRGGNHGERLYSFVYIVIQRISEFFLLDDESSFFVYYYTNYLRDSRVFLTTTGC